MNFFTPPLGPPIDMRQDLQEWRRRVTDYLNTLQHNLDTDMEAFISQKAQIGNIWTEQSSTAHAAVGGTATTLTFSLGTDIPWTYRSPFAQPMVSDPGWHLTVGVGTTGVITVYALNVNGATSATVTVRYF